MVLLNPAKVACKVIKITNLSSRAVIVELVRVDKVPWLTYSKANSPYIR